MLANDFLAPFASKFQLRPSGSEFVLLSNDSCSRVDQDADLNECFVCVDTDPEGM